MGKLAKSGWIDFIRPKDYLNRLLGGEDNELFRGVIKVINIENGDYDFFIYGPVKNFLYTENKKYSKEIIDLFNEEVSVKYSLKNYFLKGKKGIIQIPRRSRLRLHFKTLISFNEENKKIWTESLGKNDQEILESLKKNIQNSELLYKEYREYYQAKSEIAEAKARAKL